MYWGRTKIFWGILTLFIFVFLLTPQPAHALVPLLLLGGFALLSFFPGFIGKIIGTAAEPFFNALVFFFNVIFSTIAGLLQGIYIGLGEILISLTNYFISIPVSPSNLLTPPFIAEAFDFSRTLVNGFFLLILVFIGLATILRLQEYQLQRTLPKLILIVLLVNFSGVFVALIVDIANLFTHYFLNAVAGTGALYSSNPWGAFAPDPALLGQNIARIIFYLVGSIIYFIIVFIFGLRVLALWVITILAPIAFAAFILPATRKWWSQWLSALIQWAFVGLPISFFLVLAGHAISMKLPPTPAGSGIGVEIYNIFAPATALLFLGVGITMSLAMGPGIVSRAVNTGKKIATIGAGVAGGVLARDAIRAGIAKSGKIQKLAEKLELSSSRNAKTPLGRWAGRPFMPAARWAGRKMGSQNIEALRSKASKAEAEAAKMDEKTVASKLMGNIPMSDKIGYLNAKIKSGDIDDVIKAMGPKWNDQMVGIYESAQKIGQHRDMESAIPTLVTNTQLSQDIQLRKDAAARLTLLTGRPVAPATVTNNQLRAEKFRAMRAERAKQLSRVVLDDPDTLGAMLRGWDGRHINNLIQQHGPLAVQKLEQHLNLLATGSRVTPEIWLQNNNPRLLKYLKTQAGQQLGFTIV